MQARLNPRKVAPAAMKAMSNLHAYVGQCGLDHQLLELVKLRASQINGCAFCLDMHVKEAKIHGENELRLYHVPIWRESTLFSERERAALEWTEAVTRLSDDGISDDVYERVSSQFSEAEISELTFAVGVINMWNRLNISFRAVPGSFDEMLGLTKSGLSYAPRSANA